MTYDEIFNAIVVETNRPDLVAEITTAIQRSTLKMHGLEYWKFDLVSDFIAIDPASYTFQVGLDKFPRFRQICYLSNFDPIAYQSLTNTYTGSKLQDFKPADPNMLVNAYGNQINDVYYIAGRLVNFRASSPVSMLLAGWYTRPVISPVLQYDSWIASEYPFAIIDDACLYIYSNIGMDSKMKLFSNMVAEHIQILKTNYLEDQSR